jgi:hypothetical protein
VFVCAAVATPVESAQQKAASAPITIRLRQTTAASGAALIAPVYLSAAPTAVGAVTVELEFPAAVLSFDKAERSGVTEALGVALTAEVKKGSGAQSRTLVFELSAIGAAGARKPLPEGAIAHLWFTVAHDAKPGPIKIAARATAQSATDPSTRVPVTVPPVVFTVSDGPVISCFFYMH